MTTAVDTAIETVIKRDRVVVMTLLLAVIVLSWAYLFYGAGMGMSQAGMTMMTSAVWTPGYAVLMFFMWWIMMVAMMLPSATPMILLFATLNRRQREAGNPYVETSIFLGGYLVSWAEFSVIATALQWVFQSVGILSPALVGTNPIFGAVLLLAAGLYQITPIKYACLRNCRSPLAFLSSHWRRGSFGALRMGLLHGAFCIGCCWFLMGLLFFGGVMNLYWIIGLALFVLLEKTVPAGHWLSYLTGAGLILWGAAMLVSAL